MLPTQTENDGVNILNFMFEDGLGEKIYNGGVIESTLSLDQRRTIKALMLLEGSGYVKIVTSAYGDGPTYTLNTYKLTPQGMTALTAYQRGDNPFKNVSSLNHTGDVFNTRMGNVSSSAVAIGRHASSKYSSGIDADSFNKKMEEFQHTLKSLPAADQEDGEYQLEKLARAAEVGQEAIKSRVDSFYRFLQSIWARTSDVETGIFLYRIALVLFASGGVDLPKLPEGL